MVFDTGNLLMTITDMTLRQQIHFTREIGEVDRAEAEAWLDAIREQSQMSGRPIIALVDAREVTGVETAARRILAEATWLPNLYCISLAVETHQTHQAARIIRQLGKPGHIHIFSSFEEATTFAFDKVKELPSLDD